MNRTQGPWISRYAAKMRLMGAAQDLLAALRGLDLACTTDVLNPCWNNRPADVAGQHWSGVKACAACIGRAAIAKAAA